MAKETVVDIHTAPCYCGVNHKTMNQRKHCSMMHTGKIRNNNIKTRFRNWVDQILRNLKNKFWGFSITKMVRCKIRTHLRQRPRQRPQQPMFCCVWMGRNLMQMDVVPGKYIPIWANKVSIVAPRPVAIVSRQCSDSHPPIGGFVFIQAYNKGHSVIFYIYFSRAIGRAFSYYMREIAKEDYG